jgi:hypothetical protein
MAIEFWDKERLQKEYDNRMNGLRPIWSVRSSYVIGEDKSLNYGVFYHPEKAFSDKREDFF